jgi:thioredoxin reductase (NADPH)
MHHKAIIIGTGPAGLTAAIYLARANVSPLVIEGIQPGGQLTTTTEVDNFPGFPDGITGPELMENMRKQALRFGATIQSGRVTEVDMSKRPFTLFLEGGGELTADSIIISTGATAKKLGIPGESDNIGKGVSTCAASKIMQDHARGNQKIAWSLNRTPLEVVAGPLGVSGLKVLNNITGEEELLKADGIFLAIGHTPNTGFLGGQLPTDELGYLQIIPGTSQTTIPGVFACGDVQDRIYRQAITSAGSGCMAALDCERYISELAVIEQV